MNNIVSLDLDDLVCLVRKQLFNLLFVIYLGVKFQ